MIWLYIYMVPIYEILTQNPLRTCVGKQVFSEAKKKCGHSIYTNAFNRSITVITIYFELYFNVTNEFEL